MDDKVKLKNTTLCVIKDANVNKDIKLLLIIKLLHEGGISLGKAYDLCVETGLFSQYWPMIEYDAAEIIKRQYIFDGMGLDDE